MSAIARAGSALSFWIMVGIVVASLIGLGVAWWMTDRRFDERWRDRVRRLPKIK